MTRRFVRSIEIPTLGPQRLISEGYSLEPETSL
jgi:hypothetical protein